MCLLSSRPSRFSRSPKWTAANPNVEAFNRFWEPVFRDPEPLLLAMAHPIVYHPSKRALKLNDDRLPPPEFPMQRARTRVSGTHN
jgi:hypothetical protein